MSAPYSTLAICGPTASGKTALSLDMAQALAGEIINLDSVQIYRELCIGAAKVPESERRGIPHHALDVYSPSNRANVAEYRQEALHAVRDITHRNVLPILVGGSGLYLTALLHGLADMPPSDPLVRSELEEIDSALLYAELMKIDSKTASLLNPNDTVRVVRALEVFRISGRPLSQWIAQHNFSGSDINALVIVLCLPREELYNRINERSRKMVESGLLEETQRIIAQYGRVPVLSTLGYKQAVACLDGHIAEGQLAEEIALHTRRFAKRQMTYWRNEPLKRGWNVRPTDNDVSELLPLGRVVAGKQVQELAVFEKDVQELLEDVRRRFNEGVKSTEVWYVRIT